LTFIPYRHIVPPTSSSHIRLRDLRWFPATRPYRRLIESGEGSASHHHWTDRPDL